LLFVGLSWLSIPPSAMLGAAGTTDSLRVRVRSVEDSLFELRVQTERLRGFAFLDAPPYNTLPPLQRDSLLAQTLRKETSRAAGVGGGRDLPPCNPGNNLLFRARVRDGRTTVTIADQVPLALLVELSREYGENLTPGSVIVAPDRQAAFVEALTRYNYTHPCRFDFYYEYKTNDDRALAEDRFERVCYKRRGKKLTN